MLFIFGFMNAGWHDYFEIGNKKLCVTTRCFHILLIPLFPISGHLVDADNSNCMVRRFYGKELGCGCLGWVWFVYFLSLLLSLLSPLLPLSFSFLPL